MPVIGARALGLALAVALGGCGDGCPKIHQLFVLESPDSDLQALVDACVADRAACLPLCSRVLEIGGQFNGIASIETCRYDPPLATPTVDAGANAFGKVDVTYRPSSCP